MAVALDQFATAGATVTSTTGATLTTQTVAAANEVLLFSVSGQVQANAALSSVVWDAAGANQSMTLLVTENNNGATGYVQLWGLVNPTPGNKIITLSWTGAQSQTVDLSSAAFTGANQTGGATTFPTTASNNGATTPATVTITNVTGGMAVDVAGSTNSLAAPTQTIMTPINNGGANANAMSQSSAAGSVVFSWTSTLWADAAVIIAPAGGAAARTPTLTLMGIG